MKLLSDEVHYEFKRGCHWTRITAQLEKGEAIILAYAARNYIADQYHAENTVTAEHQELWLNDVLEDIRNFDEEVTAGKVYRKTYAHTSEGHANGMKFLTEEVTP